MSTKKSGMKRLSMVLTLAILVISMMGCAAVGGSAATTTSPGTTTVSESPTTGGSQASQPNYSEKYAGSEELTIEFYDAGATYQGIMTGWYAKIIKDRFNMKINLLSPNTSGGGDQLFQTRCAAGNIGDLMIIRKDQMNKSYTAGLLYDMTDLMLKDQSYIAQTYPKALNTIKELLKTDRIYGIPSGASTQSCTTPSNRGSLPEVGAYLRFDYWTGVGNPQIKNMDHLLTVMKQMQDKYPTSASGKKTYGFSFFKDWDSSCMLQALKFCWLYGYTEGYDPVLLSPDGKTQTLTDDNGIYLKTLKLYFDANQMGLVDPDSVSQNYETFHAKIGDGQILFSWWPWCFEMFNTPENCSKNVGYTFIPIDDEQVVVDGYSPYGDVNNFVFCVGSKAKDPERMVDFLNWYGSPEGLEYSYVMTGLKGLAWDIDKDGKPYLTEYGQSAISSNSDVPEAYGGGKYADGYNQIMVYIGNYSDIDPLTGEPYDSALWQSTVEKHATSLDKAWAAAFNAPNPMAYLRTNNKLAVAAGYDYTLPEYSYDIRQKYAQCGSAIQSVSWQMIFAKNQSEFDSLWTELKKTLDGLGYQDVVKVITESMNAIAAARKKAIAEAK